MNIVVKEISGVASAIKDMRKPLGSKNDSEFVIDENTNNLQLVKLGEKDKKLMRTLSNVKSGSGHDCFLKDIIVHADITATHDFILQWYRYHFRDTASSSSKMYSITKGSIKDKCSSYVSEIIIEFVDDLILLYNKVEKDSEIKEAFNSNEGVYWDIPRIPTTKAELFECIIHNTPLGYELTFGEVISYLQLKSMYRQRKNHKMSSWNIDFVNWIHTLPYSWLITGENP